MTDLVICNLTAIHRDNPSLPYQYIFITFSYKYLQLSVCSL